MKTIEEQFNTCIPQWESLFSALKGDIEDEYRATDDPDDGTPGMCVTIGFTPESEDRDCSWSYQTGDNSFSGGAYCHPYWAVIFLYRDSDCDMLAQDAANQICEVLP